MNVRHGLQNLWDIAAHVFPGSLGFGGICLNIEANGRCLNT